VRGREHKSGVDEAGDNALQLLRRQRATHKVQCNAEEPEGHLERRGTLLPDHLLVYMVHVSQKVAVDHESQLL
jgi:hypothetical protein